MAIGLRGGYEAPGAADAAVPNSLEFFAMQDGTGTQRVTKGTALLHALDPAPERASLCPCVSQPSASPLRLRVAACLLPAALCMLGPSLARADPQGISTNVPVQLDDAFPSVGFGETQLQFDGRYSLDPHDSNGRDLVGAGPTLKVGALPRLQLSFNPGYNLGSQGAADGGSASASAMWAVRGDSRWVPAVALSGSYATPYGSGHKSAEWSYSMAATKYLGASKASPRLDLNLNWTHVTQPAASDRPDQFEIGVGASCLLSPATALVVDVFHGARPQRNQNQTFIDAGVIWEIDPSTSLGLGAGVGIGEQSPALRVFFAVQRDVKLF